MLSNKFLALALCLTITGCAQTPQNDAEGGHSGAPGSDKAATKDVVTQTNAKVEAANVPMADPKITQAWLDDYEPRLRAAIKDSNLQLERRDNVLVVIAPVDGSYNPKRPEMLLPVTLGPFTRVAKAVETDPKTAVLVLGHVDATGNASASQALSKQRAQSIASIFSLSGLKQDRLMLRGMGDLMPRAANDSPKGRALNRRMEIMFTQRTTMLALLNKYQPGKTPPVAEMVAVQNVPAPAPKAKAKKAPVSKKAATKKAAAKPAAKKAPAKPAAKKAAPAKAKAADPANTQAKN